MKKTEEEKIYMEFFEEDEEDVSRIFKPAGFLQFQNGADTLRMFDSLVFAVPILFSNENH